LVLLAVLVRALKGGNKRGSGYSMAWCLWGMGLHEKGAPGSAFFVMGRAASAGVPAPSAVPPGRM